MLQRMWGKGKTSTLLVGMQTGVEISMMICQKIKEQPTSRPSNTTFGYISQGHISSYIHVSTI